MTLIGSIADASSIVDASQTKAFLDYVLSMEKEAKIFNSESYNELRAMRERLRHGDIPGAAKPDDPDGDPDDDPNVKHDDPVATTMGD